MQRGLNNKEKATLKLLKQAGYTPEVVELRVRNGFSYYAKIHELNIIISLSSPGYLPNIKKPKP